jgi:hypothetical protein
LNKYQIDKKESDTIDAQSKEPDNEYSISRLAKWVGVEPKILNDMPHGIWAGKLYPIELMVVYFVVFKGRAFLSDPEKLSDDLLIDFMTNRINEIGIEGYFTEFKKALNPVSRQLMLSRMLLATFSNKQDMGSLPKDLRLQFTSALGLDKNITHSVAAGCIEQFQRGADLEDLILGRLGYLMGWKYMSRDRDLLPQLMSG